MRRWWLLIPGWVAIGLLAETGWPAGVDPRLVAADLAVGWLFAGGGLVVSRIQPAGRIGLLLSGCGATWFAGTFVPALAFLHRGALIHLFAAHPSGRLSSPIRRALVAAGYLEVLAAGFVSIAWLGIATGLVIVAIGVVDLIHSRSSAWATPVRSAMACVVGLILIDANAARASGSPYAGEALLVYPLALAATSLVIAAEVLWRARSPDVLTRIVIDLGSAADAGTLQDRLARAIGDPSVVIGYATGAEGEFVDEAGLQLALPPAAIDRAITPIMIGDRRSGFVAHDPSTLADQRVVGLVAAAVGLAISNSATQAEIRGRMAEVDASRERLIQAADAQGQRIEADLELGAEARLGRVAELLAEAAQIRPGDQPLRVVAADLRDARERLRDLARGIYPAALSSGGLRAALTDLAARSTVPVQTTLKNRRRYEPAIESTLYFVCSEALANVSKHAQATRVQVELLEESGRPTLRVVDDGRGGARTMPGSGLRGLTDRVEALGGRLTIESRPGRTAVAAIMPRLDPSAEVGEGSR